MTFYVDTSAFLAVLDADDANHEAAKKPGANSWKAAGSPYATATCWWKPVLCSSTASGYPL